MTGATTAATMDEDREPGGIEIEDEPFDVVRANSSLDAGYGSGSGTPSGKSKSPTMNKGFKTKTSYTTDAGDLESSTVDVNAVTGGRSSRTRPMSPPSRAGLDDPATYQRSVSNSNNDNQSNKVSDDDEAVEVEPINNTDGTGTGTRIMTREGSIRNEMPMDERQSYEAELKAMMCDVGDASQGVPEFCDSAMTVVNDWCGIGDNPTASGDPALEKEPEDPSPRKRLLKLGDKHVSAGGVEEQTAIEVEYVEPLYRGKQGYDSDGYSSPKRKNALLRAMTRKAKDDWKGKSSSKTKKLQPDGTKASLDESMEAPPEHAEDNVYATFSNAEKRKFLQLINGGNTPFEATSRVLNERLDMNADGKSETNSSAPSVGSPPRQRSSGKKGRKLAFWKRKKGESNEVPKESAEAVNGTDAPGHELVSPRSMDSDAPSTPGRILNPNGSEDEIEQNLSNQEIYEDDDGSQSSCEKVGDEIKKFLREEAESVKAESIASGRSPAISRSNTKDEEEEDVQQQFEKSGINYYDAVRKDQSLEEEEYYYNNGEYAGDSNNQEKRSSRKLKLPKAFMGGFSKLRGNKEVESSSNFVETHQSIPSPTEGHMRIVGTASLEGEEKKEDPKAMEDAMTAKMLDVSNQMPDVVGDVPKSAKEIVDDLNMDAYLGSMEGMSKSFDATSVVSTKSGKTYGTNMTTRSTRSRRTGQAKVRLEKERSLEGSIMADGKPRGWQDSIEAVAAQTGKVWDPQTGWKDYVDPRTIQANASGQDQESLGVARKVGKSPSESTKSAPSDPEDLAEWRDPAIVVPLAGPPRPSTPGRSRRKNNKSPGREKAASESQGKPRGWAATMKVATARLNMKGKKWDPEKGWTGLTAEETRVLTDTQRLDEQDVAVTASNDMQDFGTMTAVQQLDEIANQKDTTLPFLSDDEEAETNYDGNTVGGQSKASTTKYIQIGEAGSVHEYKRNNSSSNVNVRKKSLNKNDADFFPEGSAHHQIKGPVDMDDVYDGESASGRIPDKMVPIQTGPNANSVYQKIYQSQGSFDDANATDFSFDADDVDAETMNTAGKAVPRLRIKMRDSASQSSSPVPLLAGPKRDTSPIRAKGLQEDSPSKQQDIFRENVASKETIDSQQSIKETIEVQLPPSGSTPTSKRHSQGSPRVSTLNKMWEARTKSWGDKESPIVPSEELAISEANITDNSENWKQLLAKKVQAETAGSDVFDDMDSEGEQRRTPTRRKGDPGAGFDDISELSPIRHDDSEAEDTRSAVHSEASTSVLQGTTFLQRLQACAAPMTNKVKQVAENSNCGPGDGPISAHLAFLKNNPGVGGGSSPTKKGGIMQAAAAVCGRPDAIVEEDETTVDNTVESRSKSERRSKSTPRSRRSEKDDMSSVVSDGFGQQSAYLEAIAMKAAVSAGKKKIKRSKSGSEASSSTSRPTSQVSSSTTGKSTHSDKFQQFLDRRASKSQDNDKAATPSPNKPPLPKAEVSDRAERFAAEKVNEMMDSMAGRGRAKEDYEETGAFPTLPTASSPSRDASREAAEELAAARVEVMMQTLSSQTIEDHEAEI